MGYSIPKSIKNTRYWGTQVSPGLAHGVTLYPRDNFVVTPPSAQGTRRYDFRDLAGYDGVGATEIVPAGPTAPGYGQESLRKVVWDAWKQFVPKLVKMTNTSWISYQSGVYPIAAWTNPHDGLRWGIFVRFKSTGRHPSQQTVNDISDTQIKKVPKGTSLTDVVTLPFKAVSEILGFVGGTLKDIVGSIGCALGTSDLALLAGSVGVAAAGTPVPPEAVSGARAAAQRMCAMKDPNYVPYGMAPSSELPILPIAALGVAAYLILRKR